MILFVVVIVVNSCCFLLKGYIDGLVWDVLYGHRLDDSLADRDGAKVERRPAVIRDDDELRSNRRAVDLQVHSVVYTDEKNYKPILI